MCPSTELSGGDVRERQDEVQGMRDSLRNWPGRDEAGLVKIFYEHRANVLVLHFVLSVPTRRYRSSISPKNIGYIIFFWMEVLWLWATRK